MSSQSVNTTAYSGYVSGSSTLGPVPLRDASDLTRRLREQIVYNENKVNSPIQPGAPEGSPWQIYGNKYRLSYLFGKLKCGNCTGGVFVQNGAYSTVPGGVFGGS